ncbi:MAG: hypothetical protein IAE97_06990 [Chthoniobacterales bacterium]|nr:hypothetical protein [Chthoniobacterales bacterium]
MHDASLWPLIFEAQRFKTYEQFLETLLLHIESSYFRFGASFDGSNITVVATKRSNRSIIGSMNNAIMLIVSYVEQSIEEGEPMDGIELQERIARTPFMALEDIFPDKAFARIAAQQR